MRNNFGFQFDFLSWEFAKLYRPKFILLLIVAGAMLHFCGKPNSERRAQILVLGTRGSDEPWQYRYTINNLNEAVKLAPKLPETYAARGNHYSSWSNFLEEAKTDENLRKKAEGFGFDLRAAPKYKKQAFKDYRKSLALLKEQENDKLEKEVLKALNCLKTEEDCYAYIHLSKSE